MARVLSETIFLKGPGLGCFCPILQQNAATGEKSLSLSPVLRNMRAGTTNSAEKNQLLPIFGSQRCHRPGKQTQPVLPQQN